MPAFLSLSRMYSHGTAEENDAQKKKAFKDAHKHALGHHNEVMESCNTQFAAYKPLLAKSN